MTDVSGCPMRNGFRAWAFLLLLTAGAARAQPAAPATPEPPAAPPPRKEGFFRLRDAAEGEPDKPLVPTAVAAQAAPPVTTLPAPTPLAPAPEPVQTLPPPTPLPP